MRQGKPDNREQEAVLSLENTIRLVDDVKENYICDQDFDNAAKWRDIKDALKRQLEIAKKPVEKKEKTYLPAEEVLKRLKEEGKE